jgi:hypothetical protein
MSLSSLLMALVIEEPYEDDKYEDGRQVLELVI